MCVYVAAPLTGSWVTWSRWTTSLRSSAPRLSWRRAPPSVCLKHCSLWPPRLRTSRGEDQQGAHRSTSSSSYQQGALSASRHQVALSSDHIIKHSLNTLWRHSKQTALAKRSGSLLQSSQSADQRTVLQGAPTLHRQLTKRITGSDLFGYCAAEKKIFTRQDAHEFFILIIFLQYAY